MNKKGFTKCCGMVFVGMVSMAFVSCGDDDEIGNYNVGSIVIETEDGDQLLVTGVGSLKYSYDSDGVLTYFYDGDGFDVTNNGTTFTYTDSYGTETCQLTLNGNGYITKLVYEGNYEEDSWKETGNMSYDGSGHLTKISYSYSETYIEDDEKESYSGSGSWTLTWSDGLLTKFVDSASETGYKYTDTYEYDYGSNTYPNAYCQYAPALWRGNDAVINELSYIFMLGIGPTYLPSTVEYTETEEEDGDTDIYDGSSSYKFSFNSDGTISYQTNAKGTSKISFTYDEYTGTSSRAFDVISEDEEILDANTETTSHLRIFGKRHRNRR